MSKQDGSNRLVSSPDVDDADATILHVDLDAFFASASLLDKPELRGLPVVVGHRSPRSVVTAATYEARRYGVHAAMPMGRALRLCPSAVIVQPEFERYQRLSKEVMTVLGEVSPDVEQLGIDEGFVGIAGARKLLGGAVAIGERIRARVHEQTGLTCSVGAASTKFIAKLASGRAKPDGLLVVPDAEVLDFLHPQPVSALWGVGPKMQERLERYGLRKVADVAHTPRATLVGWLGEATGVHLHRLAWADDVRSVSERPADRSIGHNHTFGHDVTDRAELRSEILRLGTGVGRRARTAAAVGRTITLRVRYLDFRTITRSRTIHEPTDVTRVIVDHAWAMLDEIDDPTPIRLLGVQLTGLSAPGDAGLLWDDAEDWSRTERAMDAVHERFGDAAVAPASMLRRERKREDLGP